MSVLSIILIIVTIALACFIVYRIRSVKKATQKKNEQEYERVRPLIEKLQKGEDVTAEEVYQHAQNVLTRVTAFKLLQHYNKTQLFPAEFNTIEQAAASYLASWLEFPTELDACPDEMEHMKRVTIDFDGKGNFVHYEVFKYRVNEPHWAAKDGWMLGVVGPYFNDSTPYHFPQCTFSRVTSTIDKVTPEEEANWVHENISMRKR